MQGTKRGLDTENNEEGTAGGTLVLFLHPVPSAGPLHDQPEKLQTSTPHPPTNPPTQEAHSLCIFPSIVVLEKEPKALCMLGKHSTAELHPQWPCPTHCPQHQENILLPSIKREL